MRDLSELEERELIKNEIYHEYIFKKYDQTKLMK